MAQQARAPTLGFPLNTVGNVISLLRPPGEAFDAGGGFEATYGVFATPRGATRTGELRLRRSKGGDGRIVLVMHMTRRQPGGHVQRTVARMHCKADALATPVEWTFESDLRTSDKKVVPHTRIRKTAAAGDGEIVIKDGPHVQRLEVASAYTINWALFEAVGRLPRKAFPPIDFDLIDHFDQLKAAQTLSYRASRKVRLAGRPVRLHAYDHLGRGIVPWVYYVDERGLLVRAVSGLEAYGLLSAGPAKGGEK